MCGDGSVRRGSAVKDWIGNLAREIKEKDHVAATATLHAEHKDDVLRTKGLQFYKDVERVLREDLSELDQALQGDVTESPITVTSQTNGNAQQVVINRARFPFVNAFLTYSAEQLNLTYKKSNEPTAAGNVDSMPAGGEMFDFHVDESDGLTLRQAVGSKTFTTPDDFAKFVMETLFTV